MYTHIYIYIYICMYVYVYIYIYIYIFAWFREMAGAPRIPAPGNHFLTWIVKPSGCHCTDAIGGNKLCLVTACGEAGGQSCALHAVREVSSEVHWGTYIYIYIYIHIPYIYIYMHADIYIYIYIYTPIYIYIYKYMHTYYYYYYY